MKLFHAIAHVFGWNTGRVVTWWSGGYLMVGFKCDCGQVQHAHESRIATQVQQSAERAE